MLISSFAVSFASPLPCATFEKLSERVAVDRVELPPPPPDAEKAERDAYGTYAHTLRSENFIVKWGDDGDVATADVEALLDDFEAAWVVEIEEMGHPAPDGTESWLFNVYVGNSGDGTPDTGSAGGFYNTDDEGWPMIAVAQDSFYSADFLAKTAAHEFYHALQDRVASYSYSGASAWYWEATAEWAAAEVFPENTENAVFLFGYAFLPGLGIEFFDYPDRWTLQEYHQYGAFIFPRYLSEHIADPTMIVDSWVRPRGAETPLEAISDALEDRGLALADVFGDFAAHNAVWDYEHAELYMDALGDAWMGGSETVETVSGYGTDGWTSPPRESLPRQWGYNLVRLGGPPPGRLTLSFNADAEGSDGSAAEWRVTMVTDDGVYTPVPLVDGAGHVELDELERYGVVYLAVAAVPSQARDEETFAWRYNMEVDVDESAGVADTTDEEEDEAATGCSCNRRANYPGPYALLLPFFLARRRRAG